MNSQQEQFITIELVVIPSHPQRWGCRFQRYFRIFNLDLACFYKKSRTIPSLPASRDSIWEQDSSFLRTFAPKGRTTSSRSRKMSLGNQQVALLGDAW